MNYSGDGKEIDLAELKNCSEYQMRSKGDEFTMEMLLQACILSGCDYDSGLSGVGYKTALQKVKEYKGDIMDILKDLERSGKVQDYKKYYQEGYRKAELTFKYQIVYDPVNRCERYLNEPEGGVDLAFLGKLKPDHLAIQTAEGEVNPMTLERYRYDQVRYDFSDQKLNKIHQSMNGYNNSSSANQRGTTNLEVTESSLISKQQPALQSVKKKA